MRSKCVVVIVLGSFIGAACGGGNTKHGIDASVWDRYCKHGSELLTALNASAAGRMSDKEVLDRMARAQHDLHDDALAARKKSGDMGAKIQALADSVGRAEAMLEGKKVPNWNDNELTVRAEAIGKCD